ncbi:hypothetical protein JW835_14505 [bacterium]|nr:hypothetical protein [bacterium]
MKRLLLLCMLIVIFGCFESGMAQLQVSVHGFISQGYIKSTENNYLLDSKNGSFEFNETAVNFITLVSDNMRLGLQFLARDFGDEGNHTVLLDWAYGDYNISSALGVRMGKIKLRRGLFNQGRDIDLLRTPILLPQGVYDESMRSFSLAMLGISLYGNTSLFSFGETDYEIFGGSLSIPDSKSGYWKWVLNDLLGYSEGSLLPEGTYSQVLDQKVKGEYIMGGAIHWETPLEGLKLSFDKIYGKLNMTSRVTAAIPVHAMDDYPLLQIPVDIGIDVTIDEYDTYALQYNFGNLSLIGEYYRSVYITDVMFDATSMKFNTKLDWKADSYYGQVAYRFTDWLEAASYYSEFYPDRNDRNGKKRLRKGYLEYNYQGWQKDLSLTLRFDLTQNWLLKCEVHQIDGIAQVRSFLDSSSKERFWQLFLLKATYNF